MLSCHKKATFFYDVLYWLYNKKIGVRKMNRKFQKWLMIVLVIALCFGCYDLFHKYFEQKEQIRIRTMYYLKTGQVLDVVEKDFQEGDTVESDNVVVAEVTDTGGIRAKNPGKANITVTKTFEDTPSTPEPTTPAVPPQNQTPSEVTQDPEILKETEMEVPEDKEDSYSFEIIVKEPVQGLGLNVEIATLIEGETLQLEPIFTPSNAFNRNVSWASFQENIASVDQTGLVKALSRGDAVIAATSQDGGYQSRCNVTVLPKKQDDEIFVKETALSLYMDEEAVVHAVVTPNEDRTKEITYQSANENIFTVSQDGIVKGKSAGTANLIVALGTRKREIPVTVQERVVQTISVSPHYLTMKKGDVKNLQVILTPDNATNKTLMYISSDENIVKVENGKVTALQVGTATIRVRSDSGQVDTCTVEVKEDVVEATSVQVSPTSRKLMVGETLQIQSSVTPKNATNQQVTYASSNTLVAFVNDEGLVQATGKGTCEIVITTSSGASNKVQLTVEEPTIAVSDLEVSPVSYQGTVGQAFSIATRLLPDNASDKTVHYQSNDTSVASVNQVGMVSLKKEGATTILVQTKNGITKQIPVTVKAVEKQVIVDKGNVKISLEDTSKIHASITPSNDGKNQVIYTSSNPNVVTVDDKGNIKGVGIGDATITTTLLGSSQPPATTQVTVSQVGVTGIAIRNETLGVDVKKLVVVNRDKTVQLSALIEPSNATYKDVSWKIENANIATISKNGTLKGVNIGVTNLTATAGGKSTTIQISVEHTGDKVYFTSKNDVTRNKVRESSDAMIFQSNGRYGLMDASREDKTNKCLDLLNLMNDLGLKAGDNKKNVLDFVIITHFHSDHTGCLTEVLKKYTVKTMYWKKYLGYDSRDGLDARGARNDKIAIWKGLLKQMKAQVVEVNTNTNFDMGNFHFQAYNTAPVFKSVRAKCNEVNSEGKGVCSENSDSVTYLVTVEGKVDGKKVVKRMYFAGDIQNNITHQLFVADNAAKEATKSGKEPVDVLKMGHHGYADNNNTEVEIGYLKPKYAIVNNRQSIFENLSATAKDIQGIKRVQKTAKDKIYFTNDEFLSLTVTDKEKRISIVGPGIDKPLRTDTSDTTTTGDNSFETVEGMDGALTMPELGSQKPTPTSIKATAVSIYNETTGKTLQERAFVSKTGSIQLRANVTPANTTDKITWKVGNTDIVKVDQNGKLSGVEVGVTTVTVTVGSVSKKLQVSVEHNGDKVYFTNIKEPNQKTWSSDGIIFKSQNKFGLLDASYNSSSTKNCTSYMNFLNDLGVNTIDFIAISHLHSDHYGCLSKVLDTYKVNTLYWKNYSAIDSNESQASKQERINLIPVWRSKMQKQGTKEVMVTSSTRFSLGEFSFTPYNTGEVFKNSKGKCASSVRCDENANSVTYLAKVRSRKIYFAGDIQNVSQLGLYPADAAAKKVGQVDVLKVAHHGLNNQNSSETEIGYLKPTYAVVTHNKSVFDTGASSSTAINQVKKYTGNRLYFTNEKYVSLTVTGTDRLSFIGPDIKK